MEYCHTQKGWIRPILLMVALVFGIAAIIVGKPIAIPFFIVVVICVFNTFTFGSLTIRDDSDHLTVEFGPLHLFRKKIFYATMREVEKCRSPLLGGLGIHWTPSGWLWNISGRDCVRIVSEKGGCLIGTDDSDGLCKFLETRIRK